MNRPYRRLESKTEYHWRQYALVCERIELDDGRELTKHTLKHPGAVLIVPTFADGTLLMVHQYRHAIDQYLLEFPAGTLEQSELALAGELRLDGREQLFDRRARARELVLGPLLGKETLLPVGCGIGRQGVALRHPLQLVVDPGQEPCQSRVR